MIQAHAALQLQGEGRAEALRHATEGLQAWVTDQPRDAMAWLLLGNTAEALGLRLRALRAHAESRVLVGDLVGAIDRLRAGRTLARTTSAGQDFIEASIVESRLRQLEAQRRQLAIEARGGRSGRDPGRGEPPVDPADRPERPDRPDDGAETKRPQVQARWRQTASVPALAPTSRQITPRVRPGLRGQVFRRARQQHAAATGATFGAEVDHPVGGLDDVQVVLDDDDGVAGVAQLRAAPSAAARCRAKCRPVVGSSRMYSVRPVSRLLSSSASLTRWASPPDKRGRALAQA